MIRAGGGVVRGCDVGGGLGLLFVRLVGLGLAFEGIFICEGAECLESCLIS